MNEPKKILVDLGKLKNRYSGLGEVTYNFGKVLSENIDLLKKENIEVDLLVPADYKGSFGNDVNYISLNFFRRHFPSLNKKYDLWYAPHPDSGYLPGSGSTKFLLTINDLNFTYKTDKNKIEKRISRLQKRVNKANYLTALSHFTKQEMEKYLSLKNKPVEVIYPGVNDINLAKSERPQEVKVDDEFFFHISTLMPKKNVMTLVDMMKLLPGKKLVIAGSWDSDYAKQMLKKIEEEKITNIIPLSRIKEEHKAWLMQNCEALFFPSFLEGFGIPVIESMYCGKPVFASTYTSLPEVGSDKAFYWDSFEPGYMKNVVVDNMQLVKDDPGFGNKLREYAKQFTWQNNVMRFIDLFKELLS